MTSEPDPVAETLRAAKIVEAVVGNAWATDAAGRFIYVTPEALRFLALTIEELNSSTEEGAHGWKRAIHPEDYDGAAAAWRQSLMSGEPYNVEHRVSRASGTYSWCRATAQCVKDSRGRIVGWYGTVIDNGGPATDADPTNVVLGSIPDDVTPSLDTIHPHDRAAATQAAAYAFWTGVPQVMSYRQRQPDGTYCLAQLRTEPGYGISVDVDAMVSRPDEPSTTAESLGETLEAVRAAKVIESLYGKAWAFDAGGQFTYATPAAQTVIGMTLADLNAPVRGGAFIDGGDTGWSLGVHPDDYEHAAAGLRHSLKTGEHWNVEYRMLRTTGQYVWHRIAARPTRDTQGRITGWYGTSIDIDVYKKTEAALRAREKSLQQLIDTVPVNILSFSPSGKMTYASKRYLDQAGMPTSDIEHFDALARDVTHPDDFPAMFRKASEGFATGQPFVNRFRRRCKDGVYRWIEARAQPLRNEEGEIVQWYIASIEIEDEMRAQKALQESERMLRQLVETLPAMIDCATPDGEPIYRSRKLCEFLGYSLEDLDREKKPRLAGTLEAAVHPDELASVKEKYRHSLSTGEPYALKHRLRRFDGEYRWVETRAAAMRNGDGSIVQWNVICLDIESEVRAQEKLRLAQESLARASQAASLSELSASIAHEVNQPLAAVVANSHACQRWLNADPPNIERASKTVERITRDANSAAAVVSRIRALFKQAVETRTNMSLGGVIAEAREVLSEEASRRQIRLHIQIDTGLPLLELDRVQIQQVLINLIRNGMDAMDSVTTDRTVEVTVRLVDGYVQIAVSDHGPGVEFPDKIFEPFFTTKESGMGMGLAICRSIIESHGGRLWAEKNLPSGARFTFTLPVATEAES